MTGRAAAGGTTNYLYDGMGLRANTIKAVDGSGNVLARYAEGRGVDEFLSELMSGTTSYYEQDALGSKIRNNAHV